MIVQKKVVLTLNFEPKTITSSSYDLASRTIDAMLKHYSIYSDIVYIGGDKEYLKRFLANLINQNELELDFEDDSMKFENDTDFSG